MELDTDVNQVLPCLLLRVFPINRFQFLASVGSSVPITVRVFKGGHLHCLVSFFTSTLTGTRSASTSTAVLLHSCFEEEEETEVKRMDKRTRLRTMNTHARHCSMRNTINTEADAPAVSRTMCMTYS